MGDVQSTGDDSEDSPIGRLGILQRSSIAEKPVLQKEVVCEQIREPQLTPASDNQAEQSLASENRVETLLAFDNHAPGDDKADEPWLIWRKDKVVIGSTIIRSTTGNVK